MTLINTGLISHPMNWLTVLSMVFIGGVLLHLIMQGNGKAS